MLSIFIAILVAENLCVAFYLYTHPDRAMLRAAKAKYEFLSKIALKTINRNYLIQNAPAMDDEFEEPEAPVFSERAVEEMEPEEAEDALRVMKKELEDLSERKRSDGPIARRRKLVSDISRLEQRLEDNPPKPKTSPTGDTGYIGTLEPEQEAHLEGLRSSN